MLINIELEVACNSDDDEGEHDHRSEDRKTDAIIQRVFARWNFLRLAAYFFTLTFSPSVILPGLMTTWSPTFTPSRIPTVSSERRPNLMRISVAFPSFTMKSGTIPANVTSEAAGTRRARYPAATTISAREKPPGRKMPEVFETS